MTPRSWLWFALVEVTSISLSAYHGYKRTGGDVGAAVGWGLFGAMIPVGTPLVALAQGYGKPR